MLRRTIPVALIAAVAGALTLWPTTAPAGDDDELLGGTPVRRSVEHSLQRLSQDPGPFRSIGFQSHILGLSADDLYKLGPGPNPPINESNARFTHAETGDLLRVAPNQFQPRPGDNGSWRVTYNRAEQKIYYDANPDRDWTKPDTFLTGEHVATYQLVEETDFIDLKSGVATGTATVELTFSKDFTLASGEKFNLKKLGRHQVADFQFQVNTGVPSPDPNFPLLVIDAGVWSVRK